MGIPQAAEHGICIDSLPIPLLPFLSGGDLLAAASSLYGKQATKDSSARNPALLVVPKLVQNASAPPYS